MAAPYERGSARIKVQVVATLLPLNIPVHVDSFWTLVKFSETQTIFDVQNKILFNLNSMTKECMIELVVHDQPITPSWTYVSVSGTPSPVQSTFFPPQSTFSNTTLSEGDVVIQQLTLLLKPHACHYILGKKSAKSPKPILMSYNISQYLRKSARLIFKNQLVFMHDTVLLSDSRSEILRDDDVVIINAVCGFFTVKCDDTSKGLNFGAACTMGTSSDAEAELESHSSTALNDLGENSLFCDTDEENSIDFGVQLSPEIRTKVDTILQKLTSLKQSHKCDEKGSSIRHKKKPKKRKASQEYSGTEMNNSFKAKTNNVEKQKKKKKLAAEHSKEDQNETSIYDDNNTENVVNKSKKKSKKKRKFETEVQTLDPMDTSYTCVADEVIQKSHTVPHSNGQQEDGRLSCPVADVVVTSILPINTGGSNKKNKGFGLSSLLCALRNQQAVETEDKQKAQVHSEVKENRVKENVAIMPEKAALINLPNSVQQSDADLSEVTPKRKRVRKRKNKKLNLEKNTTIAEKPECIERNYTLKLPEHQMPQNSRLTFECDSEDDTTQINLIGGAAHSTPVFNQHKPVQTQNSLTENGIKTPTQSEVEHKSTGMFTAKSDAANTSFNKAGAPIDPDEKFQALLHQCGRIGRQFETMSSEGGHAVIRSSRQKRNKHKLQMTDAVDPERDVLTNISIITQPSVTAETSPSDTNGYVQHISSAAEDNFDNFSRKSDHKKLQSDHLNSATQEMKSAWPHVEVTPLYMNYVNCKELHGLPIEGDIIAYKILELSEDYTPGLSTFKEARVINVNIQAGSLLLETRGGKDKKRAGRFELNFDDATDNIDIEEDDSLVAVSLTDLVDTRLVSRPGHRQ